MPFEDTIEGKTFYCPHETNNTCGICNKCLGKEQPKESWEEKYYRNTEKMLNNFKNKRIGFGEFIEKEQEFIKKLLQIQRGKIMEEKFAKTYKSSESYTRGFLDGKNIVEKQLLDYFTDDRYYEKEDIKRFLKHKK